MWHLPFMFQSRRQLCGRRLGWWSAVCVECFNRKCGQNSGSEPQVRSERQPQGCSQPIMCLLYWLVLGLIFTSLLICSSAINAVSWSPSGTYVASVEKGSRAILWSDMWLSSTEPVTGDRDSDDAARRHMFSCFKSVKFVIRLPPLLKMVQLHNFNNVGQKPAPQLPPPLGPSSPLHIQKARLRYGWFIPGFNTVLLHIQILNCFPVCFVVVFLITYSWLIYMCCEYLQNEGKSTLCGKLKSSQS